MERIAVSSLQEFRAALTLSARRGDWIIYHVGLLMADRLPSASLTKRIGAERIHKVAKAAWQAAQDNQVLLFQRRNGAGCEYVAVKL